VNYLLNQMVAQERSAELRRAADRARLAGEARVSRRNLPRPKPITRISTSLPVGSER